MWVTGTNVVMMKSRTAQMMLMLGLWHGSILSFLLRRYDRDKDRRLHDCPCAQESWAAIQDRCVGVALPRYHEQDYLDHSHFDAFGDHPLAVAVVVVLVVAKSRP